MTTRRAKNTEIETEMELPPPPGFVWTPLGLIEVTEIEGLADSDSGKLIMGQWEPSSRTIRLRKGMQPVAMWQTIGHELAHAIFGDSGVHLTEKQEECACDAFGSYIAAFVLAGGVFPFGDPADD